MHGAVRAWLARSCLVVHMVSGVAEAQIQSGVQNAGKPVPTVNLGKALGDADNSNQILLKASDTDITAGGKVVNFSGQTALRYPAAELAENHAFESPKGAVRAIMPPVSAEESQRARASRVFPTNLNQGVTPEASTAKGGLLQATGITGDTNARGPASIAELARSLRNNPDLIYQYVRNNIEYYPIFGVQKGALGAVLDNQGTAHDQAMLMVELLRASGIEANYVMGAIKLDAKAAAAWYGVDTSNVCAFNEMLAQGQIPVFELTSSTGGSCLGSPAAVPLTSVTVEHIWVKAKIDGTWYVFDPSFKTHAVKAGIDLASPSTSGYNAATYYNSTLVNSTSTADSVLNINRANIRNNLTTYAGNLASYLRQYKPTATLDDVIGGKTIDQFYDVLRQTTHPYLDARWPTTEVADIPNNLKTTLRIQYQGIDQTFTSDAIYGRRLTISYNSAGQPLLRLDGTLVGNAGSAASSGTATPINFTVTHNAYVSSYANQGFSQTIRAGGTNTYAITNGWGPSGRGPAENYRKAVSEMRASRSTACGRSGWWIAAGDAAGAGTDCLRGEGRAVAARIGTVQPAGSAGVDGRERHASEAAPVAPGRA